MMKNKIEDLLENYRQSLPQPSAQKLRDALAAKPKPSLGWRIWLVPAAGLVILFILVLPKLRSTSEVRPHISATAHAASVDEAVSALESSSTTEEKAADASEPAEFDSTDGLVPPSSIGDDF